MEAKLSLNELVFLASGLKVNNLYGFEYDNDTHNIDLNEVDVINAKKSLEDKGYIKIVNNNEIDIEEYIYLIMKVWGNPKYAVTIFNEKNGDIEPKEFIIIKNEVAIIMKKIQGIYNLVLVEEKENIEKILIQLLELREGIDLQDTYNIVFSEDKLEGILEDFNNNNVDKLEKSLNRAGLIYEEGYKMLEKINESSTNFLSIDDVKAHKGALIKLVTIDGGQYIFKNITSRGKNKVVIAKQAAKETLKTMFTI